MFDLRSNFSYGGYPGSPNISSHALLLNQAISLFHKARRNRLIVRFKAAVLRQDYALLDLSNIPQNRVLNQHHGGIRPVILDQIRGTLGRPEDFDNQFHPLTDRIRERWVSVAMARSQYIPLEPVNLIQVGERYFVEDGHHRVSVARALGETEIDAKINFWKVSGSLPWETHPLDGTPGTG